jgi:hypothetical protein
LGLGGFVGRFGFVERFGLGAGEGMWVLKSMGSGTLGEVDGVGRGPWLLC